MTSQYSVVVNTNASSPIRTGYTFVQGDKGISFRIIVNELDFASTSAKIVFHRANGTSVESAASYAGNVVSYTTLGNEFEVPGIVVADVKFYSGDTQRVSTASFIFNVNEDTLDGLGGGTAGYSDELEVLREQLEEQSALFSETLQEYIDAFGDVGAIHPAGDWNGSTSYHVLDLVWYNHCSWLAKLASTNQAPQAGSAYWQQYTEAMTTEVAAISDVISKNGAVNKLPNTAVSAVKDSVTFTVNADKTVSCSGTSSDNLNYWINKREVPIPSGRYILCGCPVGGGNSNYKIDLYANNESEFLGSDTGNGLEFNYNASTQNNLSIAINVTNATNMTGKVFKPMIALASQPNVSYNTFVPFAMTNRELTEKVNDLTRSYGTYLTDAAIESLIASNIGTMSNGGTRLIGLTIGASGLKLAGGIWSGLICRGDASYYTCIFFGYNAAITQYTYYGGTKEWSQYSRSSI